MSIQFSRSMMIRQKSARKIPVSCSKDERLAPIVSSSASEKMGGNCPLQPYLPTVSLVMCQQCPNRIYFYFDIFYNFTHAKKKIRFFHHEPKTTNGPNIFVVNKWQIFLSNCFAGENDTKLSCQNAQIIILYLWQSKICVGRQLRKIEQT